MKLQQTIRKETKTMSKKIVQLNEEVIKGELKELVGQVSIGQPLRPQGAETMFFWSMSRSIIFVNI